MMLKNKTNTESRILKKHDSSFYFYGLSLIVACLLSITKSLPVAAEELKFNVFKPPGELIPIGTHRLHLYCKGSGSPTVLIDSGMGSFSMEWKRVQDALAQTTRTCIYDRAGYGWSDAGPSPRTTQQISYELYRLVKAKNFEDSFVLVGHSFGGYNIRHFANENPELVAGMVLVDSSHPDQFDRMNLNPVRRKTSTVSEKTIRHTVSIPVLHEKYPTEIKGLAFRMMSKHKSNITRFDEQDHFRESARQVSLANHLPNVPLTVVSRGKRVWPQGRRGDALESEWEAMQAELSYLSTISMQIVAKNSGHSIHLDQPNLVISAVLNTLNAARRIESHQLANIGNMFRFIRPVSRAQINNVTGLTTFNDYINHANNTVYHDSTAFVLNHQL